MKCLAPGAVLGMLGAGQLGRMFAVAARQAGYRVAVFGGGPDSPCGQVSDFCFDKSFADSAALEEFAAVMSLATSTRIFRWTQSNFSNSESRSTRIRICSKLPSTDCSKSERCAALGFLRRTLSP